MSTKLTIPLICILFCFAFVNFISCSKPGAATTPQDPCAGKTIVVTATITATSGGSTTNGSINATATGSTGFTYSLNNGTFQSSSTFSNLAAGTFSITAKDASGCTGTQSFTVTASPCPTITITATTTAASSPTSANGAINATASGSTGITYSRDAGVTFQATGVFTNLVAATYNITAKDVNGCTASAAFIVTNVGCPTINVTFTSTNTAGPTATTGSISANAAGGVGPYTFSRNAGTTFQATGVFNNLAAGNYTIVAKDVNGCLGTSGTITVASNTCPTITLSAATVSSDKCTNNTGSITVTSSGSTGLMFNLNNGPYQTATLFGALPTGNYTVGVRDANGCTSTGNAQVNIAPSGVLFINVKNVLIANCALSGCHAGASPQNGINYNDDCTIVVQKLRIKARAVDGNPSIMPASGAISAADKQKIIDWINAGGQNSN